MSDRLASMRTTSTAQSHHSPKRSNTPVIRHTSTPTRLQAVDSDVYYFSSSRSDRLHGLLFTRMKWRWHPIHPPIRPPFQAVARTLPTLWYSYILAARCKRSYSPGRLEMPMWCGLALVFVHFSKMQMLQENWKRESASLDSMRRERRR